MASGDTLIVKDAQDAVYPTDVNAATPDVRGTTDHHVNDFDASQDESVDFACLMPQHYAGGGVTIHLWVMASTATSGNMVWDVQFSYLVGLDLDSDSYAGAQSSTDATHGTNGVLTEITIVFTDGAAMDLVSAGDVFRIRCTRNVDPSDTVTGDLELKTMEIRET